MSKYSPSLDNVPMPDRIRALPICPTRLVPVPFFVDYVDGKPEFRAADGRKLVRCVKESLCWVCGQKLGNDRSFLLGPMCAVNRTSAEPPSHRECAEFSARACPFLTKPHMRRREGGLPEEAGCAGVMIKRNPGCMAIWTSDFKLFDDGSGGVLFTVGEPTAVSWWAEGRTATRQEVLESVTTGIPILMAQAQKGGQRAILLLRKLLDEARKWYPAETKKDPEPVA